MKHRFTLPLSATLVALALAVTLPSGAGADREGHGRHNRRGHSSEWRDKHSDTRDDSRSERDRSSGDRDYGDRSGDRRQGRSDEPRGEWRTRSRDGSGSYDRRSSGSLRSRSREWRQDNFRDSRGSVRELRYRGHGDGGRSDWRLRERDQGSYQPKVRSRTYDRDYGRSYPTYRRTYYYGSFHRPRYIHRSGFSIGFVISTVPTYDYRYYDPYCDVGFSDLDEYYDHCCDDGHPDVILVMDYHSGYPIASCVYQDGSWVVDDCDY